MWEPIVKLKTLASRYFLWLDPGETTGMILYDAYTGVTEMLELGFNGVGVELENRLKTIGPYTLLGVEHYVITTRTAVVDKEAKALEVIGVARYLAWREGVPVFNDEQSSVLIKSFINDTMLKSIGWHRPGLKHANDAARHLLHHFESSEQLTRAARELVFSELWDTI